MTFEQFLSPLQAANDPAIVALWCAETFDSRSCADCASDVRGGYAAPVSGHRNIRGAVWASRTAPDDFDTLTKAARFDPSYGNRFLRNAPFQLGLRKLFQNQRMTDVCRQQPYECMISRHDYGNRKRLSKSMSQVGFFFFRYVLKPVLEELKKRHTDAFSVSDNLEYKGYSQKKISEILKLSKNMVFFSKKIMRSLHHYAAEEYYEVSNLNKLETQ